MKTVLGTLTAFSLVALGLIGATLIPPPTSAHAAASAAPAAAGIDWTFWIALAGLVLSLASHVLHYVAPRTQTTADDVWRDRVDEMLGWWKTAAQPPTANVVQLRNPQAGSGGAA